MIESPEPEEVPEDGYNERELTWQKIVETSGRPAVSYPPRPPSPPQSLAIFRYLPYLRPVSPFWIFWISAALIIFLFIGSVFGVARSFGVGEQAPPSGPTLQVTPSAVVAGATITLRGKGFTPRTQIGLMRSSHDQIIPLVNTNGEVIIGTNEQGEFSDTAVVGSDWGNGTHTIAVEDAFTRKVISVPIQVTGNRSVVRPPHLKLSVDHINMGAGDQASNSLKKMRLLNTGAGQISWQATTTQSWLMVTPRNGVFSHARDAEITIAVNRSNLAPGSYKAEVIFASNAGMVKLPVAMTVTPLQDVNAAVLQLSPAVLSFMATDGGEQPAPQVVTISNPGVRVLEWRTRSSASWLKIVPASERVEAAGSTSVLVSVNTRSLLPGTYNATLTFSSLGPNDIHSPQDIVVSVTITPPCVLQLSAGMLSFASAYGQAAPAARQVDVTTSSSCAKALTWSAQSSVPWLKINTTQGFTPGSPLVSVRVGGLLPGTYTGSITFTSASGTQVLMVSLLLGKQGDPVLDMGATNLDFTSVQGQSSVATQKITIRNTGEGSLSWQATPSSDTWLSLSPASGQLAPKQTAELTVSINPGSTMTPALYTGTVTLKGQDAIGKPLPGGVQTVAVNLNIKPPCTLSVSTTTLAFTGVSKQGAPPAQALTLLAGTSCSHPLTWTASAKTVPAGGTWLRTNATTGSVASGVSGTVNVSVLPTNLSNGTYNGTLTLTAVDSVTGQAVGVPRVVTVIFTVQPQCMLQAPSVTGLAFATETGSPLNSQTFTAGVTGTCQGAVTLTATPTVSAGGNWLSVAVNTDSVTSGNSATFTVSINTAGLTAGTYTGSISLAAVDAGIAILGSPQVIPVTVVLKDPPMITVTPGSLNIAVDDQAVSQALTLKNVGGSALNWSAALAPGAPAFVSLSALSGTNLGSNASTALTVVVDVPDVAVDTIYTTKVIINAVSATTSTVANGSPVEIPITITVTAKQPQVTPTTGMTPTPVQATQTVTSTPVVTPTTLASPTGIMGTATELVSTPVTGTATPTGSF